MPLLMASEQFPVKVICKTLLRVLSSGRGMLKQLFVWKKRHTVFPRARDTWVHYVKQNEDLIDDCKEAAKEKEQRDRGKRNRAKRKRAEQDASNTSS